MMNEKLFYNTHDKNILSGIMNRVNVSKEIVVICHDIMSSKDSRVCSSVANTLSNYNFNNFRFDFLSCGESDGDREDLTISRMISNLNDTLEYLNTEYGYEEFILYGCGVGAKVISFVNKEMFDIKKLILWYGELNIGFNKFNNKLEKEAKAKGFYINYNGDKVSNNYCLDNRKYITSKVLSDFNIPMLFVHGSEDIVFKYKNSVKMSKKVKHGTVSLIGGGDHSFTNDRHLKKAIKETVRFLD